VELDSEEKVLGRIRLAKIPNASSSSLLSFIKDNVIPGATVVTGGWSGYLSLQKEGFTHIVRPINENKELLPQVHLVFSHVKRWVLSTFQGSLKHTYLECYLDEYVLIFYRRKSKSRGKLCWRLMEQAVITASITRKELRATIANYRNNERTDEG
jgi:transposase-like protein